jgi:predicted  nucleic acid-binding Zn-ribbon protein
LAGNTNRFLEAWLAEAVEQDESIRRTGLMLTELVGAPLAQLIGGSGGYGRRRSPSEMDDLPAAAHSGQPTDGGDAAAHGVPESSTTSPRRWQPHSTSRSAYNNGEHTAAASPVEVSVNSSTAGYSFQEPPAAEGRRHLGDVARGLHTWALAARLLDDIEDFAETAGVAVSRRYVFEPHGVLEPESMPDGALAGSTMSTVSPPLTPTAPRRADSPTMRQARRAAAALEPDATSAAALDALIAAQEVLEQLKANHRQLTANLTEAREKAKEDHEHASAMDVEVADLRGALESLRDAALRNDDENDRIHTELTHALISVTKERDQVTRILAAWREAAALTHDDDPLSTSVPMFAFSVSERSQTPSMADAPVVARLHSDVALSIATAEQLARRDVIVAELDTRLAFAHLRFRPLVNDVRILEQDLASLDMTLAGQLQDAATAAEEVRAHRTELLGLRQQHAALVDTTARAEAERAEAEGRARELEEECRRGDEALGRAEDQLIETEQERDALRRQVQRLQTELAAATLGDHSASRRAQQARHRAVQCEIISTPGRPVAIQAWRLPLARVANAHLLAARFRAVVAAAVPAEAKNLSGVRRLLSHLRGGVDDAARGGSPSLLAASLSSVDFHRSSSLTASVSFVAAGSPRSGPSLLASPPQSPSGARPMWLEVNVLAGELQLLSLVPMAAISDATLAPNTSTKAAGAATVIVARPRQRVKSREMVNIFRRGDCLIEIPLTTRNSALVLQLASPLEREVCYELMCLLRTMGMGGGASVHCPALSAPSSGDAFCTVIDPADHREVWLGAALRTSRSVVAGHDEDGETAVDAVPLSGEDGPRTIENMLEFLAPPGGLSTLTSAASFTFGGGAKDLAMSQTFTAETVGGAAASTQGVHASATPYRDVAVLLVTAHDVHDAVLACDPRLADVFVLAIDTLELGSGGSGEAADVGFAMRARWQWLKKEDPNITDDCINVVCDAPRGGPYLGVFTNAANVPLMTDVDTASVTGRYVQLCWNLMETRVVVVAPVLHGEGGGDDADGLLASVLTADHAFLVTTRGGQHQRTFANRYVAALPLEQVTVAASALSSGRTLGEVCRVKLPAASAAGPDTWSLRNNRRSGARTGTAAVAAAAAIVTLPARRPAVRVFAENAVAEALGLVHGMDASNAPAAAATSSASVLCVSTQLAVVINLPVSVLDRLNTSADAVVCSCMLTLHGGDGPTVSSTNTPTIVRETNAAHAMFSLHAAFRTTAESATIAHCPTVLATTLSNADSSGPCLQLLARLQPQSLEASLRNCVLLRTLSYPGGSWSAWTHDEVAAGTFVVIDSKHDEL